MLLRLHAVNCIATVLVREKKSVTISEIGQTSADPSEIIMQFDYILKLKSFFNKNTVKELKITKEWLFLP